MTRDEFLSVLGELMAARPDRIDAITAVADDAGDYQAVVQAIASGQLVADWIATVARRQRVAAAGTGGRA